MGQGGEGGRKSQIYMTSFMNSPYFHRRIDVNTTFYYKTFNNKGSSWVDNLFTLQKKKKKKKKKFYDANFFYEICDVKRLVPALGKK